MPSSILSSRELLGAPVVFLIMFTIVDPTNCGLEGKEREAYFLLHGVNRSAERESIFQLTVL